MTTIFADATSGLMVCDSMCSDGGTWFPTTKVYRVGDELIGLAGSVKEALAWLKWYRGGKRGARPKLEEFSALALRPSGVFEVCADGLEILIERGFHGVGSGGPLAIAAFMAGADSERAVHIACAIDAGSRGDVLTYRLKG